MSDQYDDFDGIAEQDNPMPDWWLWTFLLSIIFAAIYSIHYTVGSNDSLAKEYADEKTIVESQLNLAPGSDPTEFLNAAAASDSLGAKGRKIFEARCVVCHGQNGEGLVGPNLTDRNWIHGRGESDVLYGVVRDGVTVKGMPAWGAILTPQEVGFVTHYVKTLEGKMLTGKAAEGELVE